MSSKELVIDALCGAFGGVAFFVMIWVAFGLDVITTGM